MRRGDGYHHGNLRRALLDAAMELVRERGIDGFTLREVARRAGVSHAAPYHHFPDRAALVATLAEESFELFADAFRDTLERTVGGPLERVRALGETYVRFAFEDQERFKLMWRPELRSAQELTAVEQAGAASYRFLVDEIAAGQNAGWIVKGDPELLSLGAWSAVHGLATLLIDGPLRRQIRSWSRVEPVLEPVLDLAVRGLAVRSPPASRRLPSRGR